MEWSLQVQELREPMRSVQNTELIDTLTVVDRDEVARETRYTQPIAVRKPEVSVHTVDDVYLQVSPLCLIRPKLNKMKIPIRSEIGILS
jgi:hypothetical protein